MKIKIKEIVGSDMSKLKFDARIHSNQSYKVFENSNKGFKEYVKWVYKNSPYSKEEILFVFEYTGLYSFQLSTYLSDHNISFALIPGLQIKRSLGISRGKSDKVDATKIALYGYRLRDEIKPTTLPSEEIAVLKPLLSLRDRLVKQRAGYKASLGEIKRVLNKKKNKTMFSVEAEMIKYFTKKIKVVDKEITRIINSNDKLKKIFNLIVSVKGIGPQTAYYLIVNTAGFTRFANYRKFASYCGIAPFPYLSGTSIRGRSKVNHLANKK